MCTLLILVLQVCILCIQQRHAREKVASNGRKLLYLKGKFNIVVLGQA